MTQTVHEIDEHTSLIEPENWQIRWPSVIYGFNSMSVVVPDIGKGFVIGHFVLIREGVKIGNNVSIGTHSEIGPGVIIGDNVRIHSGCFIPELTVIEDDVWIGPRVVITNDNNPGREPKERQGVTIKKWARIGAGSVILPGVTIGIRAFVGAGSVVTKDVCHNGVVYGNPASTKGIVE